MTHISVVTPTYNRAETIRRAIESVLGRADSDIEHIVVDDGSTDDTDDVVRAINDERFQYVVLDENRGANAARNEGIRRADGDIIVLLDSDDELQNGYFETCRRTFQSEGKAAICVSCRVVNSHGDERVARVPDGEITFERFVTSPSNNLIGSFSGTAVRADVFPELGYLDEQMASLQDVDFYLDLLSEDTIHGVDEVVVTRHVDYFGPPMSDVDGDATRISRNLQSKIDGVERLLEKHAASLPRSKIGQYHYSLGRFYQYRGETRDSIKNYRLAFKYHPGNVSHVFYATASIGGEVGLKLAEFLRSQL